MLESEFLFVVEGALKEATSEDITFAESNNVLVNQHDAYKELLACSREILNEDFVQDESSLFEGVRLHPECAHDIAEAVRESGFLKLIDIDKDHNPWNYDPHKFIEHYGDASRKAVLQLVNDYNESKMRFKRNVFAISSYIECCGDNEFFSLMRDHYKKLCNDCNIRLTVLSIVHKLIDDDC
jgi:hypothetical protein